MKLELPFTQVDIFLQYKDFQTEPSEEETEYAKWEGYKALVLKMRRQVGDNVDFDAEEVGDGDSNAEEEGDGDSDADEEGDDAEDSGGRSVDFNEDFD